MMMQARRNSDVTSESISPVFFTRRVRFGASDQVMSCALSGVIQGGGYTGFSSIRTVLQGIQTLSGRTRGSEEPHLACSSRALGVGSPRRLWPDLQV